MSSPKQPVDTAGHASSFHPNNVPRAADDKNQVTEATGERPTSSTPQPQPETEPRAAAVSRDMADNEAGTGKRVAGGARDLIDLEDGRPPQPPAKPAAPTDGDDSGGPKAEPGAPSPIAATTEPSMDSSVATLKPSLTQSSGPSAAATQYLTVETSTVPYVDPTPATPMGSSAPPSRTPSTRSTADGASPPPHHRHHRARHHVHSLSSDGEASPARSLSDDDRPRGGHGYLSEEDGAGSGASAAGRRGTEPSEIQSIMAQFSGDGGGPGEEEVMSPRLEIASPMLGGPIQHPPRKSSLEPLTAGLGIGTGVGVGVGASSAATSISQGMEKIRLSPGSPAGSTRSVGRHEKKGSVDSEGGDIPPPVPPKDEPSSAGGGREVPLSPTTSREQLHQHRPPPPEPEPEPAQPFDFQRFLEQLRNKKADPVARYLKSFLTEFGKRQWMVHEQVKIISDFLAFIADKMAKCDVWRSVSDAEFDNAREGMEKLVMNRLYSQTFSPAIPPPQPIPGASRRRKDGEQPMGPGRRGQHQEDVERDEILCQKISIYSWVREEHLDIPPVNEHGKRFLKLAQQELLKIKSYRAPRDKIICVLNCCKVIFGLLKHSKSDSSADSFMPLLIYVVLQSNPEHLVSNVQYILRFRNQDKLGGEAGYYLSSLMGAIQFIENMDRTTLTISDEEFEANVEAAVSAIAEKHRLESPVLQPQTQGPSDPTQLSEKSRGASGTTSARAGPQSTRNSTEKPSSSSSSARPSFDGAPQTPGASTPRRSGEGAAGPDSGQSEDAGQAMPIANLLRSIQKPLSTIGRMFTDEGSAAVGSGSPSTASASASLLGTNPSARARTPDGRTRPLSSIAGTGTVGQRAKSTSSAHQAGGGEAVVRPRSSRNASTSVLSAEEAAARQASAEAAEAQRLSRAEHATIVETLAGMFPDLDKDVISDVVHQKEGRVGLAVDACLALSS